MLRRLSLKGDAGGRKRRQDHVSQGADGPADSATPPSRPTSSSMHSSSAPSRPSKRVHPSTSTPLLRPSPLSQVLQADQQEQEQDGQGGERTPVPMRRIDDKRGRSASEQANLWVPNSSPSSTRVHSGPRSAQPGPSLAQQQRQFLTSQRRPPTSSHAYYSPLSSPSLLSSAPSDTDYLSASLHQMNIQPYQYPPLPAPKGRGRSKTLTSAASASSSSETSPSIESSTLSPDSSDAPKHPYSDAAPSMMHWSKSPVLSAVKPPKGVRGFTANLVGENTIWLYGGYDSKGTRNDVYSFDTETMEWYRLQFSGHHPPSLRAHTATLLDTDLFVFGGGNGDNFSNELWLLDTIEQTWRKLPVLNPITPRRAHVAFVYDEQLYVWGGGDGENALDDMWRIDVSRLGLQRGLEEGMIWLQVATKGTGGNPLRKPRARGYMSATVVVNQVVVLGGSGLGGGNGGTVPWSDCWLLNLDTMQWEEKHLNPPLTVLSHTATLVGMYLFVFGGNDGSKYSSEVHLLNLITMQWESKPIRGKPPPERAQHAAVLADGRLWIFGGFDGKKYFDEIYMLDLAANSYLAHVTEFQLGEDEGEWEDNGDAYAEPR